MFEPLRTSRLVIRPFRPGDGESLFRRRNDPRVAEYQNWALPFTRQQAEDLVAELVAMDGPAVDEWWMAVVGDARDGTVLGDLALHLGWDGRSAEIGYTFAAEAWGQGYATEAVSALLDHLFGPLDVTRVFAMLHPDNRASAMLLERTGFLFEGHTRSSFWLAGEVSDDLIYGMTRSDWLRWRERPRHRPDSVRLVPVDVGNAHEVRTLTTHRSQRAFVAPVLDSFADALFPEEVNGAPVVPWMRAIEADGTIVGFLMVALATDHHPEPFLWRLLIDRLHQRRGIASLALDLLEVELRAMGDRAMLVSWGPGRGSPEAFYLARGFRPTGELVDGEVEARKPL